MTPSTAVKDLLRERAQRDPPGALHPTDRQGASRLGVHRRMLASSAPYLAVIDDDLQHDETLVPAAPRQGAQEDADVAVASRYMAGGSTGELAPERVV